MTCKCKSSKVTKQSCNIDNKFEILKNRRWVTQTSRVLFLLNTLGDSQYALTCLSVSIHSYCLYAENMAASNWMNFKVISHWLTHQFITLVGTFSKSSLLYDIAYKIYIIHNSTFLRYWRLGMKAKFDFHQTPLPTTPSKLVFVYWRCTFNSVASVTQSIYVKQYSTQPFW